MSSVTVNIKWGKERFEIAVDKAAGVPAFKAALEARTGVPVARQKLMAKGAWRGVLKDSVDLAASGLSEGHQVSLVGTATKAVKAAAKTVFVEDLPPEQALAAGGRVPVGLRNVGNTCYLNSTLQALGAVPELKGALESAAGSESGSNVVKSLGAAYKELARADAAPAPVAFITALRAKFTTFASQARPGVYRQQDSDEFQSALLGELASFLQSPVPGQLPALRAISNGTPANVVDSLFGIETDVTLKCAETDAEPVVLRHEGLRKLICNIQGGAGADCQVNHVTEGLRLGLEGTLEKHSDVLDRNAVWKRETKIARLPKYICIQFMRFFWKVNSQAEAGGVKAKILRAVSFPLNRLDMQEFCTPELRKTLGENRGKKVAAEDAERERLARGEEAGAVPADQEAGDDADAEMGGAVAGAGGAAGGGEGSPFGPGVPAGFTGQYEAFAVVTHEGRTADSGHYIAFVRGDGDKWWVFDDDHVEDVSGEWIEARLRGGGDGPMAYMMFYRAKE